MIFCFGSNYYGQLGIGARIRECPYSPSPFGMGSTTIMNKDSGGIDYDNVEDIQCGANFSVLLMKDGSLKYCGALVGIVMPSLSNITIALPLKCKQIACGRKHAIVLMEKGIVLSWGKGYFGQLGHGDEACWDHPRIIEALEPCRLGGSEVIDISCGGSHSGVVTNSGRAFTWGLNRSGQCGIGVKTDSVPSPTLVEVRLDTADRIKSLVLSRNHSALTTLKGRVFAWGDSSLGRLGIISFNPSSKTPKQQTYPIEIPLFEACPAIVVASGDMHMLALCADGRNGNNVYSWGYGSDGQTGHSTMLNIRAPKRIEFLDGLDVVNVSCGPNWSMAITRSGRLYAWGYGDGGWLGIRPPAEMIRVETDNPLAANLSPHVNVSTFDSRHNVVLPHRVRSLSDWVVSKARGGGSHMVVVCSERTHTQTDDVADEKRSARDRHHNTLYDSDNDNDNGNGNGNDNDNDNDNDNGSANIRTTDGSDQKSYGASRDNKGTGRAVQSQFDSKPSRSTGTRTTCSGSSEKTVPGGYSGVCATSTISSRIAATTAAATARFINLCRCQQTTEVLAALCSNTIGVNCREDSTNNTPLIVACQSGHLEICKLLVDHEADVDLFNAKGNTALHYCLNYGYEDIGRYLIDQCGADEFVTNRVGLTCYEGLTHSDLDEIS